MFSRSTFNYSFKSGGSSSRPFDQDGDADAPTTTTTGPSSSSPFSFGSPLTVSRGSVLSPGLNRTAPSGSNPSSSTSTSPNNATFTSTSVIQTPRARLRGRDLYGARVQFGGGGGGGATPGEFGGGVIQSNASLRRANRLLNGSSSTAPYGLSARSQQRRNRKNVHHTDSSQQDNMRGFHDSLMSYNYKEQQQQLQQSQQHHNTSQSEAQTASGGDETMSSTARTILDALEKMSTPVRDAMKIPVGGSSSALSRAEKRAAIAEELLEGVNTSALLRRRRPPLSTNTVSRKIEGGGSILNGPPTRTIFSPSVNQGATRTVPSIGGLKPASPAKKVTLEPRSVAAPAAVKSGFFAPGPSSSSTFASSTPFAPPSTSAIKISDKPWNMEGESSLPKASENRLTDTPAVTKAGGKVRVKLGEKGAAWSEQALYGKEGDSEELPSYLKNPPKVTFNTSTIPKISFPSFGAVTSASTPSSKPSATSSAQISAAQSILTSPELQTRMDSPKTNNDGGAGAKRKSIHYDDGEVAFKVPSGAPLNNSGLPKRTSDEPTFSFSAPKKVRKLSPNSSTAYSSSSSTSAQSFTFSKPTSMKKNSGQAPFSVTSASKTQFTAALAFSQSSENAEEQQNRMNQLPDLTRQGSSSLEVSGGFNAQKTQFTSSSFMSKASPKTDILSTNGLLSPDNRKLPDVTATSSTKLPFIPQGSVMDILGKSSSAWMNKPAFGSSNGN